MNVITTRWIPLDSEKIAPSFHPPEAPWATMGPSPYDVPLDVRSSYDMTTGCFVIEFRYIEREDCEEIQVGEYFTAGVGKKTRRILMICADVHRFNRDRKRLAEQARASFESLPPSDASNGSMAVRAIETKSQPLFHALPA